MARRFATVKTVAIVGANQNIGGYAQNRVGVMISTDLAQTLNISFTGDATGDPFVRLKTVNEPVVYWVDDWGDIIKNEIHVTAGGALTVTIVEVMEA